MPHPSDPTAPPPSYVPPKVAPLSLAYGVFAAGFTGFLVLAFYIEVGTTELWTRTTGTIVGRERSFAAKWLFLDRDVQVKIDDPTRPLTFVSMNAPPLGRDIGDRVPLIVTPPGLLPFGVKIDTPWDRWLGHLLMGAMAAIFWVACAWRVFHEWRERRKGKRLEERGTYLLATIGSFIKRSRFRRGPNGQIMRDRVPVYRAVAEWTDAAGVRHEFTSGEFSMEPDPAFVGAAVYVRVDPADPSIYDFDLTQPLERFRSAGTESPS